MGFVHGRKSMKAEVFLRTLGHDPSLYDFFRATGDVDNPDGLLGSWLVSIHRPLAHRRLEDLDRALPPDRAAHRATRGSTGPPEPFGAFDLEV